MTGRRWIIHYAIMIVLLAAAVVVAHFDAVRQSQRAVEQYRQEDFQYWKGVLLPFYESCSLKHEKNPANREQLFEPLFRMTTPVR